MARTPVLPEAIAVRALPAHSGRSVRDPYRSALRPSRIIRAREAGADPYGMHGNIIAGAGYLRELHD
jgi:hypothetical protein